MLTPPSAPTPQGRAGRLLVQQTEEAKERVKQQRRTTRSVCGHSRPGYLSVRRQAVTLANPLSGPHLRRECASDRFAFSYICLFATSVRCFPGAVVWTEPISLSQCKLNSVHLELAVETQKDEVSGDTQLHICPTSCPVSVSLALV
jgi:hypothetical protein